MLKRTLTALFLLVFSSAALANFTVEQTSEGLVITPVIAFDRADAELSGPYGTQMLGFAAGETILIPTPRLDGSYKYELVLTPTLTPAQRQALEASRNNPDSTPPFDRNMTVFAQNFGVINGVLMTDIAETQTRPPGFAGDDDEQTRDQVIADDLIVNGGSLCVGFDCVNGENFGSDTIRVKENNLRIHFDDTSSTGSFPNNDWRLIANDSTNGGANLFALEDSSAGRRIVTFEAGAPANALYLESDGDLGLNTVNPVVEIHLVDGDTPTLRLEQDGSAGFGAQIWDMAGNEANFFIRDVTNGSALGFVIQPGVDPNTMNLDNEGQVAIGAFSSNIEADATLHVRSRGNGDPALLVQADATTDILSLADNGDMILSGTLAQLSRQDSKEHFRKVDHQAMLAALKGLAISTWNYKHQDDSERHLGPMAEAFYAAYGLGTDPEHIATSDMAAVALASSQALLFELEAKDQRIAELENRLQRLEALMVRVLDQQEDENTQQIVSR